MSSFPGGSANLLFCDCAKSEGSNGVQQMLSEGHATPVWQMKGTREEYGRGPTHPMSTAMRCRSGSCVRFMLGQGPEPTILDSRSCSSTFPLWPTLPVSHTNSQSEGSQQQYLRPFVSMCFCSFSFHYVLKTKPKNLMVYR